MKTTTPTQGDLDAAARGLKMVSMSLLDLDDLIIEFALKDTFAAQAITMAAKQIRAEKECMGAQR